VPPVFTQPEADRKMATDDDLERRIRERAHRIWEEEGCPEGREQDHWDQAKLIISLEDGQASMLKPVELPQPEPLEAVENQGEFPTLTDQGEEQTYPHVPGREIKED
jgi:hypothetical protein